MLTIQNLKFTKFFDVKSPVGILQKGETLNNYSIGVDLYVPKLTEEFFKLLVKVNEPIYEKIDTSVSHGVYHAYDATYDPIFSVDTEYKKIRLYENKNIQIPTGIGFLLPENVWLEVRSKSSNFKNNFTEIHGTVDMNYTYGVGVQINMFDWRNYLKEDQKFAQVVLHEAVPILNMEEVPLKDWEENDEVKFKRGIRTGGFGSSGKFDK